MLQEERAGGGTPLALVLVFAQVIQPHRQGRLYSIKVLGLFCCAFRLFQCTHGSSWSHATSAVCQYGQNLIKFTYSTYTPT